jgi:LPS export ABC transporter permease LptG
MLRKIDRYVIRETIPPFLLSLVIFTFLLEIPPVMRDLEMLVAKGVSWQVAGRIMLTLIPQALGLTIPMALLTGILIGLGRLSADRETVALLACGVSPHRLLRPVMLMAAVCAAATTYVMVKAIPDANQTFREITFEIIAKQVENDVHPRVFFENFPGWVLYARDEPADHVGWKEVLVANTSKPETELFLAARGRLVLNRAERRVDLVLTDGTQYATGKPGETRTTRFPGNLTIALNPEQVFQKAELPRGLTEKTIAELRKDIHTKLTSHPVYSPHPEIIMIEQKFSVPVACFVFALIGLALGLSVSRDGKMGGFVIGVAVIFAYYIVMYLAEAHTQGHYRAIENANRLLSANFLLAHLARWWPNILLGAFGIAALVWRDRFATRQLPWSFPLVVPQLASRWTSSHDSGAARDEGVAKPASPTRRRRKVVVVVRVPKLEFPAGGLLDRYVSRMYLRVVALAFLALVGLFYISTFIDASDKLFKGAASGSMIMSLLVYRTPQFVYFVIPIAALLSVLVTFGLLSRTSELTVMKACGISLYRVCAPVVLLSLLFSAALFSLDQEILAQANRRATAIDDQIRGRPPKTFNPLNRRWVIGHDGTIYHYGSFDPRHEVLNSLTMYRLEPNAWRLTSQTYAATAQYRGSWTGINGWSQDLSSGPPKWRVFGREPLPIESPEYFKTEDTEADLMSVAQLRRSVKELAATGANVVPQEVDLQRKLAFPFVTFVMTLLAVPFGVTTGRRGALYGIGLGIVIALSYWFLMSVFVAIGKAGLLPPVLAAWTPNIIVSASAIYLLLTAKT